MWGFIVLTVGAVYSVSLLQSYYTIQTKGVVATQPPPSTEVPNLIARFTYSRPSPKPSEAVQFTDASYVLKGTVVAWHWDFGDGATSTTQNPIHTYSSEGVYPVTLTVTDNNGQTNSVQIIMEVKVPDYTVHKEGTLVQAINVAGVVEYESPTATLAIQYAFDQAGSGTPTNRKMVFIEDGVYTLTKNPKTNPDGDIACLWLWDYEYLTVEGQSWNTILKTNNINPNVIYFVGTMNPAGVQKGIRIANLQITTGSTSEHPTWNMQNGIQTCATQESIFETLYIHDVGRTGMYNTEFSETNIIRNSLFENNYRYGASYTSSGHGHVHNNHFIGNKAWGLNIDSTYGPADYTVAEFNVFENHPYLDLFVIAEWGGIYNILVQNNIFISSASTGILKTTFAKENIVIQNNYMEYSGSSGQQVIMIQDSSEDIRIINNHIISTPVWAGIYIDDGSNCLIEGNHFEVQGGFCVRIAAGAQNSDTDINDNTFIGEDGVYVGNNVKNTGIRRNDFRQITGTPIADHGVGTIIEDNLMP